MAIVLALPLVGLAFGGCAAVPPKAVAPAARGEVRLSFKVPPKDGEFRRSFAPGIDAISCIDGGAPVEAGKPPVPCLRIGPMRIGDSYADLLAGLARLGLPPKGSGGAHTVEEGIDGTRVVVLPIESRAGAGRPRLRSYVVATVDAAATVRRLQVTGVPSAATSPLSFSDIALGADRQRVADVLGHPSSVDDVPAVAGEMWDYSPFPFRLELVEGRVHAIVVEEASPQDALRPFVPLRAVDD